MDSLFLIGLLVVLWVVVGPLAALIGASRANQRTRELLARIDRLEAWLAAGVTPGGAPEAAAAPVIAPAPEPVRRTMEDFARGGPWRAAAEAPPSIAGETGPATSTAEAAAEPQAPAHEIGPLPPLRPPSPPPPPRESLESKIGGRWSVLVGGLALALGAIFLVRFTIEQGLLGPGMRIALGFALAGILFAAGEWLRRRDRADAAPIFAKADVPAILTAAAGVATFATIYAAYALYGFIDAPIAFVLLTAAGLATLFLSTIHGPGLAALGLLGSYAAPLLVSSAEPSPLPVAMHTLAVTAAVLAMARIRGWRWLAIAGIAASLGWGVLLSAIAGADSAELLLVAGLTALFVGALAASAEPAGRDRPADYCALGALAGVAALSLWYGLVDPAYPPLASGIVLAGALGAAASRYPRIASAALIAGALAVGTVMLLPAPFAPDIPIIRMGALSWRVLGEEGLWAFALKAAAPALLVGIGGFLSADRLAARAPVSAGWFAASGAGAPLLILIVVYLRHVPFETRPIIGLVALVLAALFAAACERLIARRPADDFAPAPAFYAAGAAFALALAIAIGLSRELIPLAFSLAAAGIVWVALYRPVAALPWLAVVLAALAGAALIAHPPFIAAEIGTRPILNGLIIRVGLPAAAILFAGEMLRRRRNGFPAAILQAIGLALAGLFTALEIRHAANGGAIVAGPPGLGEQSALTLAALGFAIGLQRIAAATGNAIYRAASLVAGIIGCATIAAAHLIAVNPLFTGENVGARPLLNLLLPGYLLPALAAAWLAAESRRSRPRWYVGGVALLSLALGFVFVTLTVRHAFHGPTLDAPRMFDAENWTYSAVWLVLGAVLLAAGIALRSLTIRAASGLVIAAVICKVFLFDMAALTGALRAASFLGLGMALIVIGRVYQRLLARGRANEPPAAAAADG